MGRGGGDTLSFRLILCRKNCTSRPHGRRLLPKDKVCLAVRKGDFRQKNALSRRQRQCCAIAVRRH